MTLQQLDHPCFVVRHADGTRIDEEIEPHVAHQAEADEDARERTLWTPEYPKVAIQTGPCFELICDDCGDKLEDSGEGYVMHLDGPDGVSGAIEAAEGSEDKGQHLCLTCTGDRFDCEGCYERTRFADLVDDLCPACRAKPDPNQLTIGEVPGA